MINKKGFTLIEVLLIILLIGMLGVTALSTYFNTSDTFKFLSEYKTVVSMLREVRANAISSKDSETIDRYGIKIEQNKITVFADADTPFTYDLADGSIKDFTINDQYAITFLNEGLSLPVYLYYENGSGNLSAYHGAGNLLLSKSDTKRLDFKFSDNGELQKFISVFQVTGIAEEFKEQPQ